MRPDLLMLALLAATLGGPAHAQTSEPADALAPKSAGKSPGPKAAAKTSDGKPKPKVAVKPPTPPAVAAAAPPPPVLPPPLVVPLRPVPPPLPAAVVAEAAGEATPQKDGLRVTFGPGSADLNPQTDAAIRGLVRTAPPFAGTTFGITAVAPGSEEDPSTPRRLSLARALAVRSVLITEGIASPRIYVRALGASPLAAAGGPPDRADLVVTNVAPARAKTP